MRGEKRCGILDEEGGIIEGGIGDIDTGTETATNTARQYSYVQTAGYLDLNFDLKSLKRQRLYAYMEAEKAILLGAQSYTLDNRTLTRANLSEIRKVIADLWAEIALEESAAKNGNVRRAVFID